MPVTTNKPKPQPPMEAVNPALELQAGAQKGGVVSRQPTSEPPPTMNADADLSLRGGGLVIGCHKRCCGINCSWFPCR
ncbi:hypothetical protein VTK26DRAFT_3657 [Humicola hyalothermophila]